MTLKILLPPEAEKSLADRAAASGVDVDAYVGRLIQKDIDQASFAELFAPLPQAVEESGMSESEIDTHLQNAISDSRRH